MERAPPPALAAAALAMMDEELTDTPLSPKRPRQDDPPSQVGTGAGGPRPRSTMNDACKAAMLASASRQHTPSTIHSHTSHRAPEGRTNPQGRPPGRDPTQPRYRPRAPARGAGPAPYKTGPHWGNVASKQTLEYGAALDPHQGRQRQQGGRHRGDTPQWRRETGGRPRPGRWND